MTENQTLVASSRKGAVWEMWSRVDAYRRIVYSCIILEDLAEAIVCKDRFISRWYACSCRGLRARIAGGARIKAWRPSPGCGVNIRRQRRYKLRMGVASDGLPE